MLPPDLNVSVSDHVSVAESVGVLLKLAPVVAQSTASLDLTSTRRAVADLTADERATVKLMSGACKTGLTVGGVAGATASIASGDPVLTPVGAALGGMIGPFVAVGLHDRPMVTRVSRWLVRFASRLR